MKMITDTEVSGKNRQQGCHEQKVRQRKLETAKIASLYMPPIGSIFSVSGNTSKFESRGLLAGEGYTMESGLLTFRKRPVRPVLLALVA